MGITRLSGANPRWGGEGDSKNVSGGHFDENVTTKTSPVRDLTVKLRKSAIFPENRKIDVTVHARKAAETAADGLSLA